VRNFPDAGDFKDLDALFRGNVVRCDAIEYSGVIDGEFRTRYCGNMFNIGFDCNVVDKTAELKKKPFLSGSLAYLAGVAYTLIKKNGADLKVTADGKVLCDGPILLTSIANGSYCGGGVMSNPYASVQDGKIDISVIRDVSRAKFIALFPKYQKGTHLDTPAAKDIITNLKAEEVTVTPRNGSMRLCTDGEISTAEGVIFRIQPKAFNLLVPAAE
jgi:diacylglycerol kinase family enzyme